MNKEELVEVLRIADRLWPAHPLSEEQKFVWVATLRDADAKNCHDALIKAYQQYDFRPAPLKILQASLNSPVEGWMRIISTGRTRQKEFWRGEGEDDLKWAMRHIGVERCHQIPEQALREALTEAWGQQLLDRDAARDATQLPAQRSLPR